MTGGGTVARKYARSAGAIPSVTHAMKRPATRGGCRDSFFSTHPDTGNRIAALQAMAAEFEPRSRASSARAALRTPRNGPSALDPLGRRRGE